MQRINLIPSTRRLTSQRRRRIRLWVSLCAGYTAVALTGCLVFRSLFAPSDTQALQDQLNDLDTQLAQVQSQQNAITPRLNEQRLILAAERSITDQPDWSLLLSHLADDLMGDRIVLNGCTLAPADGPVEVEKFSEATLALTLTGHARSAKDVSQFVLRLEASGLFDEVKLVKTNLEPYMKSEAIVFEVRCLMIPSGAKT